MSGLEARTRARVPVFSLVDPHQRLEAFAQVGFIRTERGPNPITVGGVLSTPRHSQASRQLKEVPWLAASSISVARNHFPKPTKPA